jgi:hypothetical protein
MDMMMYYLQEEMIVFVKFGIEDYSIKDQKINQLEF